MANHNITRAEAKTRSEVISVDSYLVDIDVTVDDTWFSTTTTVTFSCSTPGAATWIDLISAEILEAKLNGEQLDVSTSFDGARLQLSHLAAENTLTIRARGLFMNTGEGLHRFVDPVDGEVYLYTQFETADARRMYACFEQPDLKATFTLSVTAPAHWQVVSNETVRETVDLDDARRTSHFNTTPRMSTYITALVAGPYAVVRDEYVGPHGTYPLGVYCRESLAQYLDADDIFTITKQGFAFFEKSFGVPYPFTKYDQLFVPEFNAGAMENAGCVTFLEDYVFRSRVTDAAYEQRSNTILHEMAHMWFGDLVTMTWWDDLWLNESFAEWAAHHANVHATRHRDAWTTFANLRKAWAYRQDQLPSTHPIAADMVDLDAVLVNFDGITYAKGAAALRQLVAYVGEPQFLAGLHNYFTKYAWGNTELVDLLAELEQTSGRDLSGWAAAWLQTSGVNLMSADVDVDGDGRYRSVIVNQQPPEFPPDVAPRPHRIRLGLYDVVGDTLNRRDQIELDVTDARTHVAELDGVIQPDLLLINDDDLTFAKIRLDERSWDTATHHLGNLDDSLARAVIWSAAWDMTRDGEVSTGAFVDLVLAGVGAETDIGVVQGVLRQARTAIDVYASPGHRNDYLQRFADALESYAWSAQPGSDRQLAFFRAFAGAARSDEHLAVIAELLEGKTELDGLVIDTDLRWSLLQRLVVMGRRGDAAIDAELVRDATASGQRQAAVARAARPNLEAKTEIWNAIVSDTDLPNAIVESMIGGFMQRDQLDIVSQFRQRFFDDVGRVWADRTPEIGQSVAIGLYPAFVVEYETIAATDEFLANPDLNSGLRRLVSEGRDGVIRAIRAQSKDA